MESEVIEFTAVALLFCLFWSYVKLLSLPGRTCCWASGADAGKVCVCVHTRLFVQSV